MLCVTWGPVWVNEWQQYSYERGVYEGAAISSSFVAMGEALSGAPKCCDVCRAPLPRDRREKPEVCSQPCASTWLRDLLASVEARSHVQSDPK